MKTLPAFYLDFSLLFDLNFYAPKEQRREGGGEGRGEKKKAAKWESCSCQTTLTVLLHQFDLWIKGIMIRINLDHFYQQFPLFNLSETVPKQLTLSGVSNGPIQLKGAHKIWPLLELLAKITRVLACSCSQNFCNCWHTCILVNMCSITRNFINSAL